MIKRIAATLLLAGTLAIAGGGSSAHADSLVPLSLQVGIGTAANSSSDKVSSTSFHAGASLTLTDSSTLFVLPGTQGIDVDYNYASGHGGHYNVYGATYTNRISLVPKAAQGLTGHVVPYVGFGLGVFQNEVKTRTDSANQTDFGGKLVAGFGLPRSAFFEVSYILSGVAAHVRTDSINFAIGTHI